MTGTLAELVLAVTLFVASHFVLAGRPLRDAIVARIGERLFHGLFSAIAAILIVWVASAYNAAPVVDLWYPPIGLRHLSLLLLPVACVFVIAGVSTPNPTVAGVDGVAVATRGPVGIAKVTRHPVMWGIGIWGIAHLLANGDAAGTILFAGMTILALAGARAIDAKKRRSLGDAWSAYAAQTSYLPFAAMIAGRVRLSWAEIGWWRLALGLALFAALVYAHPWLFGVSPLP